MKIQKIIILHSFVFHCSRPPVDLSDCTLYGVDEAVLTEAVILSYRGQPELGATLVKRKDHLTCHDFTMTQQLLAIQ